jgi:serine/threonine-protein kinase
MVARGDPDNAPAALVGTLLLAKWRILRPIARGGTSTVYEAVHRNGRRAAVKVLHPTLAADKVGRARFLRESLLANRVNHPSVVPVIDDDIASDGTVFLVMDLLEGETLDQRWKRSGRVLPMQETLSIVAGILDPLAAVHRVGIVHRDLKPSNVFLSAGGIKLLDFGVACLRETTDDEGTLTRSGSMLGTPAFMAPEQARGHWNVIDARTDIWAVGAITFSLLAGRFVHEGGTPHDLLIATATQTPLSLARIAPGLPSAVVELVDRALRLHKDDRWPDALSMLAAVRAAQAVCGIEPFADTAVSAPAVGSSPELAVTMVTSPDTQPSSPRADRRPRVAPRLSLRRLPARVLMGGGSLALALYAAGRDPFVGDTALGTDVARRPQMPVAGETREELPSSPEPPQPTETLAAEASSAESRLDPLEGRSSATLHPKTGRLHETGRNAQRLAPKLAAVPPSPPTAETHASGHESDPEASAQPVEKMRQTFSGVVVDDDELDRRR